MRGLTRFGLVAATFVASAIQAQEPAGPCARPDSIAVLGTTNAVQDARDEVIVAMGGQVNALSVKRAVKKLYDTGRYADVQSECLPATSAEGRTLLVFRVTDRPVLDSVQVTGVERLSGGTVRERVDLLVGRPIDPAQVARAVARIDSLYEASGYYLAEIAVDTTPTANGRKLTFRIDEGRRMAISGIRIEGNRAISDGDIVAAMQVKPEAFFWWKKGEFDDEAYAGDLAERIPALYASRGFIDMQVLSDTVIIDRDLGKGFLQITVREGPQYRVGAFEVNGAKVFSGEDIARYYPFREAGLGLGEVMRGVLGRGVDRGVFDQAAWSEASGKVKEAYSNVGYIYAQVDPVVERTRVGPDSTPVVNLRWDINELSPAVVNRIAIVGNDVTTEACIRDQLFLLPGDVFNRDRLIRSWQNIGNLGFFETPLPEPETPPANEKGDLDLIFRVKEKKTGNVNFGASVGQGTGVGGFIGFDQPNLLGMCKRGSLQWQFGQYINDFNLSFQDPRLRGTRTSMFVTAYHSRSRFIIQDIGRTIRTGGQVRFGFPLPTSRLTRLYLDYGGEKVQYGNEGLVGTIDCASCFRSSAGVSLENDTRLGMPFPFSGVRQSLAAQFNGGPLGGTASFQRYTGEMRSYSTLAQFGGKNPGSEPLLLIFGLSVRAGAVFGDPGPFFVSQSFSLGGVQFGEPLRGYDEFSITPNGYVTDASQFQAQRASFGNAFYVSSAELSLRLNQQIALNAFYDAGNLFARPRDFDPTRLFRGAGFGASLVTPLGPLGLDLGYGFDRLDATGRKAPGWQVHFKFGQFF